MFREWSKEFILISKSNYFSCPLNFLTRIFILSKKLGYRITSKLSFTYLAFASYNAFFVFFFTKSLELVSMNHFLHDLRIKIFLLLYSINRPNFIFWLSLFREIFGNMCIVIVSFPGCNVINLEINPIFLIKPFY